MTMLTRCSMTCSCSFESHLARLTDVLNRLRSSGVTLNVKKCQPATDRIRIFGFQVDKGLITPYADKIKSAANWPVPRTRKQLASFVGLAGYYRDNINRFAERALGYLSPSFLARHKPYKL